MDKGHLPLILEKFKQKDLTYEGQLNAPKDFTGTLKDNQLTIFKSTLFEDDEDRALTKNDGTPLILQMILLIMKINFKEDLIN